MRLGLAMSAFAAVLLLAVTMPLAQAQRKAKAVATSQAVPPAKDTIFARKILMSSISDNMDEIEAMLEPGGKFETAEAREHADLISIMLLSFPHMFPPATNQWKDGATRDAAHDTFASPDVWTRFQDFYARAKSASDVALQAAKAASFAEYKARAAELRTACDACHALYLKIDK